MAATGARSRLSRWSGRGLLGLAGLLSAGCNVLGPVRPPGDGDWQPPAILSAYGLFRGSGSTQEPAESVVPYAVNTPLFSDYASKYRFLRLPPGTRATYHDRDVFDFPVGTVLVKTFAYEHDGNDPGKGRRLIETRLLIRRPEGWVGLPYVWNAEQTEATLQIVGGATEVRWRDLDGRERMVPYLVPNVNQCLGCHEQRRVMQPIGTTARNLNRAYRYADGRENQLPRWARAGLLRGAPEPEQAPRLAVWNDPSTGTREERARAWLESNCGHCHNPEGAARMSGLDLRACQTEPSKWGLWKTPVAAGRGSGGRAYAIVPGKPDESILVYRIESTEPGVMMPELSRRLVDAEGVALVRAWIAGLKDAP